MSLVRQIFFSPRIADFVILDYFGNLLMNNIWEASRYCNLGRDVFRKYSALNIVRTETLMTYSKKWLGLRNIKVNSQAKEFVS